MTIMRMRHLFLACLAAASTLAAAQVFPAKPITLVVPYSPGGGHDAMARVVAERLQARLAQTVLVDNKAGANGMLGAEYVTRAAPDGYTLLFASPAEIVISPTAYKTMRYDPSKDLAPVTLAGMTPLVVVANPATGVKTMSELIAMAMAQPGKLSFGTAGNASSQHLAGALLNNMAGIDLQHIPYKAAQVRPFLGGQFHEYVFGVMGEAALPKFYEESLALGFETIEISDNTVPLTDKQRHDQIALATRAGLHVFGEVGSKETQSNPSLLVEQAKICLDAGATLVLVEAAELMENGRLREDTLDVVRRGLPAEKIMIELPGPWIQGVRSCDIEDMKKVVLREFGPDVNLANIDARTIYDTEVQRVGLGTAGPLSKS